MQRYIYVVDAGATSIVLTADEFYDFGNDSTFAERKEAADQMVSTLS